MALFSKSRMRSRFCSLVQWLLCWRDIVSQDGDLEISFAVHFYLGAKLATLTYPLFSPTIPLSRTHFFADWWWKSDWVTLKLYYLETSCSVLDLIFVNSKECSRFWNLGTITTMNDQAQNNFEPTPRREILKIFKNNIFPRKFQVFGPVFLTFLTGLFTPETFLFLFSFSGDRAWGFLDVDNKTDWAFKVRKGGRRLSNFCRKQNLGASK